MVFPSTSLRRWFNLLIDNTTKYMNCKNCQDELSDNVKFCENCGNKINTSSKFCSSYRADLTKPTAAKSPQENNEIATTKPDQKTSVFVPIIISLFFVVVYITFLDILLGLAIFLFIGVWVGPWALGRWFPKWYMKREKVNVGLVKWIVWSNVLTWSLPPLGVLTGFAALKFADYFPSKSKKYKIIAVIALIASVINAIVGVLMRL
jgi:hypothetical protein